jgi:hypothetical protein
VVELKALAKQLVCRRDAEEDNFGKVGSVLHFDY